MNLRAQIFLILFAVGCGGESTLPAGTAGAPCYPNGTCNLGLVCVATTCTTTIADAGTDAGGDAGSGSDGSVVDGSTTDAGTDSAVADAGADQDAGADSGTSADAGLDSGANTDAGTSADAGVDSGTLPSCVITDTDTGTYTFLLANVSTYTARFNLDGFDNSNTVAGCGIQDTSEGYDNGAGTMAAAEFVGGSPHGVQTIGLDATLSAALFGNASHGDLTVQVVLTHLKQNLWIDMNDPCVGVHLLITRPNEFYPTPLGSSAMVNGRVQGTFDRTVTLPFNIGGGTMLTLNLYQPVFDLQYQSCGSSNSQLCINTSLSFIGGHVFMAPTDADMAAGRDYSGVLGVDEQLYSIWSGFYATYTRPYLFQYQDIFMNPDGTKAPCGTNQPPNAYATTLRFAR